MAETPATSRGESELEWPPYEASPWRYRLRSLLLLFVAVAIFLTAAVAFVRWSNSRPGKEVIDPNHWPHGLKEVADRFGLNGVHNVRVWHLYGGWFAFDHIWRATASREALTYLQGMTQMKAVSQGQMPAEFWNMPPDWSEMPKWWDPQLVPGAEYYMSPTFVPKNVGGDRLDCCAMYDPERKILYVWSQWDF